MSNIPAMYNRGPDGSITGVTFYLDFVPYQSDASHAGFPLLLEELKSANPDAERLVALTQPIKAVEEAVADAVAADYLEAGVVGFTTSQITYNGEVVTGVLVERILSMLAEGFDVMPMVRFLENVYRNPALYARDELYLWLEAADLPITADGCFLAYKMVNDQYRSRNNFLNLPGTTVSMPRQEVDIVRAHTCSTGLHFCSKGYLPDYGGMGGKIVMVKVNPADVVSIPNDYGNAKGRAWKYDILADFEGDAHTKVWPAVVADDGTDIEDDEDVVDPNDDFWVIKEAHREALGELFKMYNAIADDPKDREARLEWASDWLSIGVDSFNELTLSEIGELLEYAEDEAADREIDARAAEALDQKLNAPDDRQNQVDAINSLGIIKLRKLTGKWKGHKAAALRQILIDQIES